MSEPLTRRIHHLGFTVANLAFTQGFFTDGLNFKLLGENLKSLFIKSLQKHLDPSV